ncbi:MAG TPA: helix-turn-helix transcriptional regulator [Candidatus Caccomorpha excrementavium]|nr:helix-turn-helix transcriptional regulator [Candidatus Caccomorpha excrementavium]
MPVIDRILKLTEERHISNRKLTMDLGLSNSAISEWKKGKAKPSLEAVVKIARYFGVTTDYLLLGEDSGQEDESAAFRTEEERQRRLRLCRELTGDELILLERYNQLDHSDREYIQSKMIVLKRESEAMK